MDPKVMALIIAATAVQIALLFTASASALVVLAVLIIEVVLIMVVGGAARHLPAVLRTILAALGTRQEE